MTYPFWQHIRRWFLRLEGNELALFTMALFLGLTALVSFLLHTLASWLTGLPSPVEPSGFLAGVMIVRNFLTMFLFFNALTLPLTLPLSLFLWHGAERLGWVLQDRLERGERDF